MLGHHDMGLETSRCGFESRNARRIRSQSVHGRTTACHAVRVGIVTPWDRQVKARSYNGHYPGLSIRRQRFDSATSRQVLRVSARESHAVVGMFELPCQ